MFKTLRENLNEMRENFHVSGFHYRLAPLIFFKNAFLENYDRYETQTFRVD